MTDGPPNLDRAERINKNSHQLYVVRCLCLALFSQFHSSCSLALASFSSSLSFGFKKRIFVTFEEKKTVDSYIAGFVESMARTNTEKITKEILEGLSEDTDDSDSYDVESGDEDSKDHP
jgi:hypothetical protein